MSVPSTDPRSRTTNTYLCSASSQKNGPAFATQFMKYIEAEQYDHARESLEQNCELHQTLFDERSFDPLFDLLIRDKDQANKNIKIKEAVTLLNGENLSTPFLGFCLFGALIQLGEHDAAKEIFRQFPGTFPIARTYQEQSLALEGENGAGVQFARTVLTYRPERVAPASTSAFRFPVTSKA